TESRELMGWLRAAAEPTRLRLLGLCAGQDLSVCDLAQVLAQSEPRVSRHLRILTEAGLLERVRQGQWVHYRMAHGTPAANFARGLLGQLDRSDPSLVRDRQRARSQGKAGGGAVAASRLARELRAVLEVEMNPRRQACCSWASSTRSCSRWPARAAGA
ncbi:ArsR family transcriptional regulator, partial [mine drainage metagenome]